VVEAHSLEESPRTHSIDPKGDSRTLVLGYLPSAPQPVLTSVRGPMLPIYHQPLVTVPKHPAQAINGKQIRSRTPSTCQSTLTEACAADSDHDAGNTKRNVINLVMLIIPIVTLIATVIQIATDFV
jgi:hypothetical protein